ncbi:hypothetical protein GCM10012275_62100 [Longimycelium tulufanense]|uniref:DNA-binding phage zinc finger domain-containing protein n=1 Tax=Longimycelium tulufanense TaxID=907463 RepID=A0A8J3CIP8_9PSEU|nr:hypothetical protein [Longimycelium tulufanense]GGM83084.1 hypothetical protein GCM10012275_62100 [Longimycelium tulufanense]
MNEPETAALLAAAKVLDPRFPKPDEHGVLVRLWQQQLRQVPFPAAQQALLSYYASERYRQHRQPISAADVLGEWRDAHRAAEERHRSHRALTQARQHPFDPDRLHRGVDQAVTQLAQRWHIRRGLNPQQAHERAAADRAARRAWLSVACPHCRAPAGEPCWRPTPRAVGRVRRTQPHPSRITEALQARHDTGTG